jgi:folate-binding protein YgfZ
VELARFVFRTKVSLRAIAGAQAIGCDATEAQAALGTLPDNAAMVVGAGSTGLRLPGPSPRWLLLGTPDSNAAATSAESELNRWRLDDIRAGLPVLAPALQDQLLPQWLGLGRLGAINVGKGCYPGQEVMARLHFKGGNKRGLYRIQFTCQALPAPGTELFTADAAAASGVVVAAAWDGGDRAEALVALADTAVAGPLRCELATMANINVVSGFA